MKKRSSSGLSRTSTAHEMITGRRAKLAKRREQAKKRSGDANGRKVRESFARFKVEYKDEYYEFIEDKTLIRAWFTTEALYSSCEFFQSFFFLLAYYFCFGYFTNIILCCVPETQQPVYMARIHGYLGYNKIVLWN